MNISISETLKRALIHPLLAWIILFGFFATTAHAEIWVTRIDSNFRLEDFERNGDGYKVTISNDSVHAFSNFLVVILGTDISGITVYRSEFPVEFMEGKSQQTFLVSGYDDRVFEVNEAQIPKGLK